MKGGKRENAGRRKGSINKRSQVEIDAARATGELPHEFLLRVARGEPIEHAGSIIQPNFDYRFAAAQAAAPYFAPKLASVEQKIEETVNHVISGEILTDKEFEDKYATEDSVGTTTPPKDPAGLPV